MTPAPAGEPASVGSRQPVLVATALAVAVGAIGGSLTRINAWYFNLVQPWFKPPDWLFGPAWSILYGLMVWSAVMAWRSAALRGAQDARRLRLTLLVLWGFNALANVSWSFFFFFIQRPDQALVVNALLAISIILLMAHLRAYCRKSAWLLLPYLVWVSFAGLVNLGVVRLNGPVPG